MEGFPKVLWLEGKRRLTNLKKRGKKNISVNAEGIKEIV